MTDPLSITTTMITLATALKDLINLAQNIRESFKKPARNKRAVQALAEETLDIVIGLKNFYEGHKEKLEDASEMRDAVLNLFTDMNTVHNKCRPILQIYASSDSKLRTRIKQKINAWWNRDDLEEQIRNLRDMANKCDRQFMRYGMMRIEAAAAQIQATAVETQMTTVQIRSAVANGFARAHGNTSPLRVSDQNTLAFLGSAPVMLSSLPPHVQLSERLVYRLSITLEVSKIDKLFKTLASCGYYPSEEPDSLHLECFRSVVNLKPSTNEEIEDVQSNIFALIVKIQESLKSGRQLSIQRGADAMSDLFVWLSNLSMAQESLTIAQCAVNLYRTLAKTNEDVYGPRLAHALRLMSLRYVNTGDVVEAYKVIKEAVTIGRRLEHASPTFEAQMQLAKLLSCSAYVGRENGDWTNASKDAEGALQLYQRLIETPIFMLRAEVEVVGDTEMTLEVANVHNLADALMELHYSLSETTRHNESVEAGNEALELYRSLEQRHNRGAFSNKIAGLCSSLASDEFREIVPVEQALVYAQKSVQHYEKVLQKTGVVPNNLPDALGSEVKLLSRLERFDEAYGVCQKLACMVRIQMDNQELRARSFMQLIRNLFDSRRYTEAALTVETWSSMYRSLLSDQQILEAYEYTSSAFAEIGDHSRSFQVAEASVTHWRMLTTQNTKYLEYVARSVLSLTRICFLAEDYERAFKEGGEALQLFSSLISEDSSLLKDYMFALQLNIDIAKEAKMELKSLERSRLVVLYSRALVKQFPAQRLFLIRRIRDHALLLAKFDHLTDASDAISETLDWFDGHPAQDSESEELCIDCLLDSVKFLRKVKGHPARLST